MAVKTRLLVVDDERLMRMSLRMVLGEEGYQVDTAKSVAEAQDMLDQYFYQVLITDLVLPDGKGFDIIRYARKMNGSLESILLTGSDSPVDEDEALMAGAGVGDPQTVRTVFGGIGHVQGFHPSRPGGRHKAGLLNYQPRQGNIVPSTRSPRTA